MDRKAKLLYCGATGLKYHCKRIRNHLCLDGGPAGPAGSSATIAPAIHNINIVNRCFKTTPSFQKKVFVHTGRSQQVLSLGVKIKTKCLSTTTLGWLTLLN
jgi:hypothetical protein